MIYMLQESTDECQELIERFVARYNSRKYDKYEINRITAKSERPINN